MVAFLTLEHITHYYFSEHSYKKALDDISLTINEGEFAALLGPSGCGKSTILSIISGLIKQTSGEIMLEGKTFPGARPEIGYMLQQDYLFPWKKIIDNVLIGPKINHTHSQAKKEEALNMLEEVGLTKVADNYPNALSGGMRQRVALVRTLITNPKLLLLDEPFSALDYQTKLKLEDLVSELLKAYQKTAVLVTHDIGEAIAMADRIFLMDANPGTIAHVFEIPDVLRDEQPFLVRRHPEYQKLFDRIWAALNTDKGAATLEGGD